MKLKSCLPWIGQSLSWLALGVLLLLPALNQAEMLAAYSGCPCTVGNWPSVNFAFTNNAGYPVQLKGFRFKTPAIGSYSCFGGAGTVVTGAGPYQYEIDVASTEEVRPVGSVLNTLSCGGSTAAGDGTPYDLQLLVKTGACNAVTPMPSPTPAACAAVSSIRSAPSYYSSTCVTDYLGKNGGIYSGGFIDTFTGTQIQVGLPGGTWTESGTTVTFDPTTMGGPLYMMATAMGQEYFSIDMQMLFGVGSKESFAAMRQVPGGALFIPNNAAGVNGTYHIEVYTLGRVLMSYPNFFPRHACASTAADVTTAAGYACVSGDGGWVGVGNNYMCTQGFSCPYLGGNTAQLVNSVISSGMNFWWIYDALSLSTNLCFNTLLEDGADDESATKILLPAYNLGINSGFESAILPPDAGDLADTDISDRVPAGNGNYVADIMTTIHQLEAASSCGGATIYDARITQTDLETFFFGNGGTAAAPDDGGLWRHFPNLYSSSSARTALWNDVLCAFNTLKGLAPTAGLTANEVSYRYDFLTILRVAKQHLNLNRPFPTQSDFTSWVQSRSTNATACGTTIDNSFPALAISSPNANSPTAQCPGFTVSGTASDNVAVDRIDWTLDPTWLSWNTATTAANWSFSVPGSEPNYPAAGAQGKLWVRITDACGNSTIQQLTWTNTCGTPTPTATRTSTRTATRTASPTATRTATRTNSPSVTASPSASPSATGTASPSATPSPASTATATPSRTASASPTASPSASPSASPAASATDSPTRTPSATASATPSASPSFTATATASPSPSASPSGSASPTRTPTVTPSASPSGTFTLSPTVSPTALGTFTETPTGSVTPTVTPTATPSASFTASATLTATRTATPSASVTASFSATATRTVTLTVTPSGTLSPSFTQSQTLTPTPSFSPSPTESPSHTVSPTISTTAARFFQQSNLIKVRGLYPNPFSDRLRIYFTLRVDAAVACRVYNVAGEPIMDLSLAGKAGPNELTWLGDNLAGARCASGVYVLKLEAQGIDGSSEGFWEKAVVSR